jgi:hypothetical protein
VSQKTNPPRKTAKNNETTKLSSKEPSKAELVRDGLQKSAP